MLYEYELSQSLRQFNKDLKRLAGLAEQWQTEIQSSGRCSHFIHHVVENPLALERWTLVTAEAAPFVKRYSEFLKDKEVKAKDSGGTFLAKNAGAKECAEFCAKNAAEKVIQNQNKVVEV